jgi:hypothetical protein
MESATYTRRIKNSREIVGVSTVTFGSKNEPTPTAVPLTAFSAPSVVFSVRPPAWWRTLPRRSAP